MALKDARTVREIAETWNHRANDPIGRCLDKYDSDLLKVARGIHSVSVLSGDNSIALSQQAADHYQETVIEPFVSTARVRAQFDSRFGLYR